MNFDLTDDQLALRDGIRALVEGRFPMDRVRDGFDRSVHAELADAGVFSLRADGFSWADAAVVFEELGRGLVPGPLVWCFGRDRITSGYDASLAGSDLVEFLGLVDDVVVIDPRRALALVHPADVVAAGEPEGWPLDPLTPVWRTEKQVIAGEPLDLPFADVWDQGALLTAAYCVGMADRLTEMAVAYAQERQQFDRPIGSFQAVKHICADMAVRAELARVATHAAACVLDDPATGSRARALAGAKVLAGEAAILNGRSATQVYGGMGFTWEVDVHLFLKRAWVLETQFGGSDHHADALASTMPGSHA
ncbi:MAG: acyl-CoA/acyl-ACP dehydrogenase [Acidimicrobiia bacterium]|nr:acyl-CoA/acyl-ACP dehydrogenase [Acidimicrobiia bacterium]